MKYGLHRMEDREGESISWHLAAVLGLDPKTTKRIVFHEITAPAIKKAVQNPRTINMDLVNAQQARRILDRIVGFELSPVLWRKIGDAAQPECWTGAERGRSADCRKGKRNQ